MADARAIFDFNKVKNKTLIKTQIYTSKIGKAADCDLGNVCNAFSLSNVFCFN